MTLWEVGTVEVAVPSCGVRMVVRFHLATCFEPKSFFFVFSGGFGTHVVPQIHEMADAIGGGQESRFHRGMVS
jgi:hypothetical protein